MLTDAQSTSRHSQNPDRFETDLLKLVRTLRGFATSLCHNKDGAEDLVQEALLKAWKSRARFVAGTNLKAWLFTIVKNQFYSERRRSWRQVPWDQDQFERSGDWILEQDRVVDFGDTLRALALLSEAEREAILLVDFGGFSSKEAAAICHCTTGTVKWRASRTRQHLRAILEDKRALSPMSRRAPAGSAISVRKLMQEIPLLHFRHMEELAMFGSSGRCESVQLA